MTPKDMWNVHECHIIHFVTMAKSGVLRAQDLVLVNKTFEGYVKPFKQRRMLFFTILHIDVKHKSKINRNLFFVQFILI